MFFDDIAAGFVQGIRADFGSEAAILLSGVVVGRASLGSSATLGPTDGGFEGSFLDFEGGGELAERLLLLKRIIERRYEGEDAINDLKAALCRRGLGPRLPPE